MTILWLAVTVGLLIVLNGVCVAAELSLVGARRSRLESLAAGGSRGAQRVLELTANFRALDRAVATAQVGITVSSLGMGMYAEKELAQLFLPFLGESGLGQVASHGLASAVALGLLTCLHVVVGEMIPKTFALQHPVQVAIVLQAPLRGIRLALAPLVFLLDGASRLILRLVRFRTPGERARAHTLDEIQLLVEQSGQGGGEKRRQTRMLRNLLEFEDLPVRKVMVPRNQVVGLPATSTRDEVLAILRQTSHTRYPVFERNLDHIIGFVHTKQILTALQPGQALDLRSLARPVPMVPETARARRLLHRFREEHVHLAVVLDEHGGTAGIATLQDLLEEIFGTVKDEFDTDEPDIRRLSGTSALVRGSVRIDEINDAFGLKLSGRFVDTIAGLILQHLGRTARCGDVIHIDDVTLTVISINRLAISQVRIETC